MRQTGLPRWIHNIAKSLQKEDLSFEWETNMTVEISFHHPTSTNDTLVGFVDSPDGRGTLSILFTCLLTLSLCVWSAIHLDLPKPGESSTQYTVRYFKWSIVGLFAPEILIWVAWRQYLSARVLTQSVHEVSPWLLEQQCALRR